MNRIASIFLVVLNLGLIESQLAAQHHIRKHVTTDRFIDVIEQVNLFAADHGPENVLLVVDLDNTLLAMNQDLGSDQWFTWQESLLNGKTNQKELAASDFAGLLRAQGILFSLGSMHPPEPELPEMITEQVQRKICVVILTSRGKEYRDATNRELQDNHYSITASTLEIDEKRGAFKPYDSASPTLYGLTSEITSKLGTPRTVTYSDGIYMTAGQHKGYMLKTLLARHPRASKDQPFANFKAIVFADDHVKHTDRVRSAFADDPIDLATFRYSKEDAQVERFKASSKQSVIQQWDQLRGAIQSTFAQ